MVGLSGGVDSSVAAARLREAGYDVVGAFIKTWQPEGIPCNWREERRMAMRVAAHLRIPFLTVDLSETYKREVIDRMLAEYLAGLVPNPDVLCNKSVKFGAFLDFALAHGFDAVATGHYARKRTTNNVHHLLRGIDPAKDQSYFLSMLDQHMLAHAEFPIGGLYKTHVRNFARAMRLPTATKKDSQGLCFIGPMDVHEFLRRELRTTPGPILNERGEVIGEHDGAVLYAIGQRQYLRIFKQHAAETPLYVISKDLKTNSLVVAPRKTQSAGGQQKHMRSVISLSGIRQIRPGALDHLPKGAIIELRYHGPKERIVSFERTGDTARVVLLDPQTEVSVGQIGAVYVAQELLGGGVIDVSHD